MRLKLKNFLNTIESFIRTDATVARVYQFPDRDITIAGTDDVATVQSDATQAISDAAAAASAASTADGKAVTAQADIDAHEALTNNPHSVTKTQVGLGSVDNTADTAKPVSTAQQAALDTKQDKSTPEFKTTDYTIEVGDSDLLSNSSSAIVFTVPTNTAQPIAIGHEIQLTRYGSGTLTIAAQDGTVTVNNAGSLTIDTRYTGGVLKKIAANEWIFYNGAPALTWTSFTPTITGWTSTTEIYGAYIIEGKRCTLHLRIVTTASQGAGTTATITNLPAIPKSSDPLPAVVINNATAAIGRLDLAAGSSTGTFYATGAAGAWTANTPRYVFFSGVYEIQ